MIVRIRRSHPRARFIHPMDPEPRTAILAAGFQETTQAHVFPQGWDEHVARFGPSSIAAPTELLRRLVSNTEVHLDHSLVAFTYGGTHGLTEADRDLLWHAFGVPVFEQYLGPNNELLASECDAHAGLHVLLGCEHLALEREVCGCGSRAPRIARGARIEELVALLA